MQGANWSGLAIEGVEVELGRASAYSAAHVHLIPGSMIRTGTQLRVAMRGSQGFQDVFGVPVEADVPEAIPREEVGHGGALSFAMVRPSTSSWKWM